ncbi:MAG: pilus assembly protein PilC [Deltaproteobacteria bacterium RBG_13_43_22]|nr:MAG: pilus assembly protein PilC [Deltaproteobacteria bacterium RBG_13_43_22]
MPTYNWEGKSKQGEKKKGELVADNPAVARLQLRKMGILPGRIQEKREESAKKLTFRKKIPKKLIVIFTRQFATMINAGLPLVQCLNILATQQENAAFSNVINQVKGNVESGQSLAEALKAYPRVFDQLYINLVEAGETGGILDVILNRLSSYIEKSEKLKKKVKGAMVYPAVVTGIAVIVTAVILIFVIPIFEKMFSEVGQALPAPTQIVIALSRFVSGNIIFIFLGAGAFIFIFRQFYRTEKGKYLMDDLSLKLPIFGMLLRKVAVAKFTRTFGTMVSSGVPILEAMDIVARSAGNKVVEKAIYKARGSIAQGRTISEPLAESKVFPPMVTQMIGVGEASGELDTMLNKIADFYDDDVDAAVSTLTSMMEPIMMVVLGGIVGGLVISMYLPIFKMGEAITG